MLINNAGISGRMVQVPDVTPALLENVLATNVVGVVRVTQAFVPLLERSSNPVIVNVSSGMGSIGITSDPGAAGVDDRQRHLYPLQGGAEHAHDAVREGAARRCASTASTPATRPPTSTATAATKTVEQGAEIIVRMALLERSGPTGTYVDEHGTVPW